MKKPLLPMVVNLLSLEPGLSNEQLFKRLQSEFPKTNPKWLRARICDYRYVFNKYRRKGMVAA